MANVKKGTTVKPPQWWKHLREWKRTFWKQQRRKDKAELIPFKKDHSQAELISFKKGDSSAG